MLVLTRKIGEEIVIAHQIKVRIAAIRGRQVRLAIAAPDHVPVHRHEIRPQPIDLDLEGRANIEEATDQT